METNFNFKSSVCTSIEQSEKLLALGLKKETADMRWERIGRMYDYYASAKRPYVSTDIPAWSLHRLIEMMPEYIHLGNIHYERTLFPESICYYRMLYQDCGDNLISFDSPNLYDRIVHCIEWLIKEGYFNKEYLNGTAEN